MKLSDNYLIIEQIGSGSFGDVYKGRDIKNNKDIAIKVENITKTKRIRHEYKVYKYLKENGVIEKVPKIVDYITTPKYNFMCMEMLGKSIDDIFNDLDRKFKIETVLKLGIDIVNIIKVIHKGGFIHRDIKPSNFMVGKEDSNKVYILDFGLAKKLYDNTGNHIRFREGRSMIGTVRYCSINMHLGLEPSMRDDLESVGYMLIYLAQGKLPWQGLKKTKDQSQVDCIGEVKMCTSLAKLCEGLPDCFKEYIIYTRKLKFDEQPDYEYLIKLFDKYLNLKDKENKYEWVDLEDNELKTTKNTIL
uniref:non-specific serine/threonine protein kinase n=1 Tax=viral metagenome TaxID=1070528 RepID=A0A6C0AD57_9ZZZZ